MRIAGIIAVTAAVAAGSIAPPASAQSEFCLPLQMELAALNNGRPDAAGDEQALRQELARTREEARRAGCTGGLFFRKKASRSCGAIVSRLNRLERQVSAFRPRGLFLARTPEDRERDRIRRALARAGCSERTGTYRTICVRVCDGYYFPLSFATARARFEADQQKCLNQYGPGEAALYYHPNPGGDASQAVSLSGERYFDQPYAFAYRSAFHRQCARRLHEGLAALAARVLTSLPAAAPGAKFEAAVAARMAVPAVPIPIPRADRASDPETVANRAGRLVPAPVAPPDAATVAAAGVRAVGDPYLFTAANPGPPPTVPGYMPPELRDFRVPQKASMLPAARSPGVAPDL